MNEDILSAAVGQLKSKIDSIMVEINGIVSSNTYVENATDKIVDKLIQLASLNEAYKQAVSLCSQALAQKLDVINKMNQSSDKQTITPEDDVEKSNTK